MTAQYRLREDVAEFDRQVDRLTKEIEDRERELVNLRGHRDEARFHAAEARAAAEVLDNIGFRVEKAAVGVTVFVNPREEAQTVKVPDLGDRKMSLDYDADAPRTASAQGE